MLDFGKWIVEVAVNGVKSGSFDRAWAAMQLGNHYSRDRITAEDIARFDEEMNEYEAKMKAEQEGQLATEAAQEAEGGAGGVITF